MGLDMYIKRCAKTEHTVEELEEIDNEPDIWKPECAPFLPLRKYEFLTNCYSIFHEAAYWRKFNALHGWFVDNVQDGVDECQMTELCEADLLLLLADITAAIDTQDPDIVPPVGGFFFGTTEVDQYYWEQMNEAKDTITELLEKTNWDKERLFYRSSW